LGIGSRHLLVKTAVSALPKMFHHAQLATVCTQLSTTYVFNKAVQATSRRNGKICNNEHVLSIEQAETRNRRCKRLQFGSS
jgi:hypothetical protein